MKIGDLVKFEPSPLWGRNTRKDDRRMGTILKFDLFHGGDNWGWTAGGSERIIEVLWNTGEIGWILQERIEVINAKR